MKETVVRPEQLLCSHSGPTWRKSEFFGGGFAPMWPRSVCLKAMWIAQITWNLIFTNSNWIQASFICGSNSTAGLHRQATCVKIQHIFYVTFGHYPVLTGKGWNKDGPVNQELCLEAEPKRLHYLTQEQEPKILEFLGLKCECQPMSDTLLALAPPRDHENHKRNWRQRAALVKSNAHRKISQLNTLDTTQHLLRSYRE